MCRRQPRTRTLLQETIRLLRELNRKVDTVSKNQDQLDQRTQQLGDILDGIRGDVDVLKQAAEDAGADLDFTALDAKLDQGRALDAENPAPTPTEPPAEPTA